MGKYFLLLISIGIVNCYEAVSNNREGRVFSLFNIVKFENEACTSTESFTSTTGATYRNGTCYSSSECSDKGGKSKGSCAAGFGVCCLFLLNTDSSTSVTQNNTYIQSPGYPTTQVTSATSISYTINKCSDDICFLRLDFEKFVINGVANSQEYDGSSTPTTDPQPDGGACSTDTMVITGSVTSFVPTICGTNDGQHIYVPMGESGSTTTAELKMQIQGDGTNRQWDILVSQIPCGKDYTPPSGCLQWFTGTSGTIKTFNFDGADDQTHLQNQDYQACIRQQAGMCCNQYTVCDETDTANQLSFSIYADNAQTYDNAAARALEATVCTQDYITIGGGSSVCSTSNSKGALRDKFCGSKLNTDVVSGMSHIPICDCSPSFAVGIVTDAMTDLNKAQDATNANAVRSRGVCLDFTQQPC